MSISKNHFAFVLALSCLIIFGFSQWYNKNEENTFAAQPLPNFKAVELYYKPEDFDVDTKKNNMKISQKGIQAFTEISRFAEYIGAFCPTTELIGGIRKGWTICRDYKKTSCSIVFITTLKGDCEFLKEMASKTKCSITRMHPHAIKSNVTWPLKQEKKDMLVLDRNDRTLTARYNSLDLLKQMMEKGLLQAFSQIYFSFEHFPYAALNHTKYLGVLLNLQKLGFDIFNKDPQRNRKAVQYIDKGIYVANGYILSLKTSTPIEPLPLPGDLKTDNFKIFHRYMNHRQAHCRNNTRIGNVVDGGWNVCNDAEYRPSKNCLVYSFGIANSWSFDEMAWAGLGCEVHCFDPSIGFETHNRAKKIFFHPLGLDDREYVTKGNWSMASLKYIRQSLGHTERTIDILKMDIEDSEWTALPEMISSGALKNVRQLSVEYHDGGGKPSLKFFNHLEMLKRLYDAGFQVFWSHPNSYAINHFRVEGTEYTACYEIYYVNKNFTPS